MNLLNRLREWKERRDLRTWFRVSRRMVPDLYEAVGCDPYLQFKKGYVYPGNLWMMILDGHNAAWPVNYYTILGNQELRSPSLKKIEDALFKFYEGEVH